MPGQSSGRMPVVGRGEVDEVVDDEVEELVADATGMVEEELYEVNILSCLCIRWVIRTFVTLLLASSNCSKERPLPLHQQQQQL